MPLNSAVKQSAVHNLRRPSHPYLRAWLWAWLRAWLWACVVTWACVAANAMTQDFPEAAEDNHFIFGTDGTYSFSYDTGSGDHQSFRTEARDSQGRVTGRFGYVDPDGVLRITEYQADSGGYRANMEIYHLVSMSPRTPLLVGPLPQPVSQPQSLPDFKDVLQHTTSGPVEPSPFIPPQRPVLIIGPLPKPLQPPRSLLDQSPPDLSEDTLLGASPESLSLLPPPDFLRGPRINDSSRISSPEVQQEEVLDAITQRALEDARQHSETELPNTSILNATFELSNNTFQSTDLKIESPQSTIDYSSQDLLQESKETGKEVAPDAVEKADESTSTSPEVPLRSTENTTSISVANNIENNLTESTLSESVSKTTYDIFAQVNPEQSRTKTTEKRQNNFKTIFSNETSSQMLPVTMTINTTISQSTIASVSSQVLGTTVADHGSVSLPELGITVPDHRSVSSPELGTNVADHRSASSPELGSTVADHMNASSPELGTTVADHRSVSSPELGTTVPDHSSVPSPEIGTTVPDHRSVSSPELGTTVPDHSSVPSPEIGTIVPDHRSVSSPELGTTVPDHSSVPSPEIGTTVSDHRSVSSPELGTTVADHRNDADQSVTLTDKLPPVPALTYLPVTGYSYDIPKDAYSELPLTFTPFA